MIVVLTAEVVDAKQGQIHDAEGKLTQAESEHRPENRISHKL